MSDRDLSLVDTSDGLQVILDGRPLYDENPAAAPRDKATRTPVESDTLYLVVSPVAWHGVSEFAQRIPASSAIIAVESDPTLFELSRRLLELSPIPGVELRDTRLPSVLDALTSRDPRGLGAFRRVRQVAFSRAATLGAASYRALRAALEANMRVLWQNRLTTSEMARLWFTNLFRNLPALVDSRPLPVVTGPILVCGAGPSLDRSVDFIRNVRSRVVLFAADTALPALLQNALEPDLVVATEAQFLNVYDFLQSEAGSYRLVADIVSSPAVVDRHSNDRVHWISAPVTEDLVFERLRSAVSLPWVPPLGSVGVTAVSLALMMGTGPVLLSGLDFAVERGDPAVPSAGTHARGSNPHTATLAAWNRFVPPLPTELRFRLIDAEGAGGTVRTTLPLMGYAEQLVETLNAADGRTIASLEPFGLRTGGRPVGHEEAASIVAGSEAARLDAGTSVDASLGTADILGFLENEGRLLDELARSIGSALSGSTDDLERSLAPCTYVARGMPDFTGEVIRNPGFYNRLAIATDYFRERVERSLRSLHS